MPIRIKCPSCSSALSVPDSSGGKLIKCPKCQVLMRVPETKSLSSASRSNADRPTASPVCTQEDDEENRPRKGRPSLRESDLPPRDKSSKKRKKDGRVPTWMKLTIGGVLAIVLVGTGGIFTFFVLYKSKDKLLTIGGGAGQSSSTGGLEGRDQSRPKYVPRISEQKLEQFLKDRNPGEVTEDQVYAIMGEPTRRDAPVTGRKNGQVFTVYTAYWEEPGSGVKSSIGFSNGRIAGMILGLEISSPKSDSRK